MARSVLYMTDSLSIAAHAFATRVLILFLHYMYAVAYWFHFCTTCTLKKRIEKKLDGNCTRMLQAEMNKFWKKHTTKQQLYGHLPTISKTIQIRRIRHAGDSYINKNELMKRSFFQAAVTSILLYGCTTWTLTKRLEKKLDGNYTRILRAILNKSWRQHPTRHQLYGHLPPITKNYSS